MKKIFYLISFVLLISLAFVTAQTENTQVSYCAERTTDGAWCQNVPFEKVDQNYRNTPASCDATSFCRTGFCFDSNEGTCSENTPQKVCDLSGGLWLDTDETPLQCQLGCCLIGDQAAYVTQTRCKALAKDFGLEIDFRSNIKDELSCIALAQPEEEGACVIDSVIERNCRRTTKAECDQLKVNSGDAEVTFHNGFLCSAEELATECGPSKTTTCVEGKDEIYFTDTCGNIANIYDSSKQNDQNYWREIKSKAESCNPGSANVGSNSCGNCNYLGGSICKTTATGKNVCEDLSCSFQGQKFEHGETWCADSEEDTVGSRYYRYLCFNGETQVEACADFRNEVCISSDNNGFSSAACRVNRWQDCYSQKSEFDCENTDKRDCRWIDSVPELTGTEREWDDSEGACVPLNAPGFDHYNSETNAQELCNLGNAVCVVKFEEKIIGGKQCIENCECLEDTWEKKMDNVCVAIGDCGGKLNWQGVQGGINTGAKIQQDFIEPVSANEQTQGAQRFESTTQSGGQFTDNTNPSATGTGNAILTMINNLFEPKYEYEYYIKSE